jgi:hypothetical protein
LLAYHAGELHYDWKTPFLNFVIEKKIATTQDINWPEFLAKFPTRTMEIMSVYLTNILHKNVSDQPFYKRLIDIVPTLKHMTERSSAAQHREDIAFLYDKVRGIN